MYIVGELLSIEEALYIKWKLSILLLAIFVASIQNFFCSASHQGCHNLTYV